MTEETTASKNELITVVQLPVIKEYLHSKKADVDKRVSEALAMVCTEETVRAVKAERANLSKEFTYLETQRKTVKSAIMKPYEDFEAVYKECVSDAYKDADTALKGKIDEVESEQKRRCEDGLREYFAELCAVHHLDWLTYERAGIKVDMASAKAKTPGRLRKQLAEFVVRVNDGVNLIASMEDADEIMAEFRETLDAAQAIGVVQDRHRRVEEARAAQEARKAMQEQEAEAVRRVEALAPPVVAEVPKTVKCTFTVRTTMDKLKKLKEFLNMEGIQYE